MKDDAQIHHALDTYSDLVRRICFVRLKNKHDTEDVFQSVFLKFMLSTECFASAEHEKAWFIRVTLNACKDWFRALRRHPTVPMEVVAEEAFCIPQQDVSLLEDVLSLPEHYRDAIYLFYYEGYTAVEIAGLLGKKENTIYTWLSRGKALLKEKLEVDA